MGKFSLSVRDVGICSAAVSPGSRRPARLPAFCSLLCKREFLVSQFFVN